MATKPLPIGTHNLTVNVPVALAIHTHRISGRLALSMGAYVRRCLGAAKFVLAACRIAGRAEAQDLRALEILEAVLRDGHVDASELPAMRDAIALIRKSAELDHIAADMGRRAESVEL